MALWEFSFWPTVKRRPQSCPCQWPWLLGLRSGKYGSQHVGQNMFIYHCYMCSMLHYIYNYSMLYTFSLGHAMKFSRPGLNLEAACGRAPVHIHKHVQKGLAIWLFQAFYFQNRVHDTNLSPIDDDDDDDDFVNLYFKLPNLSRTQMLCRSVYIYTTGPVKPQPCTHACIIPCKISEPG